jgi:hypothetical protein
MSQSEKDGGCAFPLQGWDEGMTLQDYFAGQALVGIIGLESDAGINGECADAYLYANEMLKARKKETNG